MISKRITAKEAQALIGKKKRAQPERELQKTVRDFLTAALPRSVFFTAFPAGGGGAERGGILKSMGLKAGLPDLLFIFEGHSIWIELKADKGKLSPEQKATIAHLLDVGATVHLCRSIEDVAHDLTECGIPLKYKLGQWTARKTLRAA